MRPGIIQSGRIKQTQPQIRSCSPPLFILPAEEMHFRSAFISLGLLFPPYGQLGIWAMKEKLAALCSVRGNVYFWPRIYQRSKAIMAVKELLEFLCSVMRRCSLQWRWMQLLRPIKVAERGKAGQWHFFPSSVALSMLQVTNITVY